MKRLLKGGAGTLAPSIPLNTDGRRVSTARLRRASGALTEDLNRRFGVGGIGDPEYQVQRVVHVAGWLVEAAVDRNDRPGSMVVHHVQAFNTAVSLPPLSSGILNSFSMFSWRARLGLIRIGFF